MESWENTFDQVTLSLLCVLPTTEFTRNNDGNRRYYSANANNINNGKCSYEQTGILSQDFKGSGLKSGTTPPQLLCHSITGLR